MRNDSIQEKRQSKRYLCDEFFTNSTLQTPEGNVDITAIDFNKEGIRLFSSDVIPESGKVSFTMHYENPALSHEFYNLPCSIVYCHLIEVGSHCGIRFNLNEVSEIDRAALEAIEEHLVKCDDPDDRYHLFGDD
tara:strand:+ start:7408 stop:7809 length:402 start_codon:yes stop_codon:yes gene_type:complete